MRRQSKRDLLPNVLEKYLTDRAYGSHRSSPPLKHRNRLGHKASRGKLCFGNRSILTSYTGALNIRTGSRGILEYSHIQALLDPRVLATIQTIHSKPVNPLQKPSWKPVAEPLLAVVLQLRGLVGTEISSARLCPQHSEALQALRGQKFGTWGLVV